MPSLAQRHKREVAVFVNVCHRLARTMYVTAYGGNLAWKLDADVILITPTQLNKGDVTPKDVVFINRAGATLEGTRKPTGEKPMYLKFFAERPDIVSVLHCHPPHVCALAIMKEHDLLMKPFYPETTTEVGPVPLVPYAEPLTEELARNFTPLLQKYNAFIMENHGLVIMTRGDIYWTLLMTELLESTAQSILIAKSAGTLKPLSLQAVRRLGNVMRTRNLPLFGAPGVHSALEKIYFPATTRRKH